MKAAARLGLFTLLFVSLAGIASAKDKVVWKSFTAEELAMKENPANPGEAAMILDWEVETNDVDFYEIFHYRVKIFSEAGKKYANVEIPFLKELFEISDIHARTIQPDGKAIEFSGQIFEKTIAKTKQIKYLAKTFTLPDVQPGSIIEYRYKKRTKEYLIFDKRWVLQDDLFVRSAKFRVKPYTAGRWGFYTMKLGFTGDLVKSKDGYYELELKDIPAFIDEGLTPPDDELKPRLEMFYDSEEIEAPPEYWKRIGKDSFDYVDKFIGDRKGIKKEVAALIQPSDSAEAKLRKLYGRVQQLRNLSFERDKSEKEQEREKLKDSLHVEDVLKNGYGSRTELNWLFVAMARAAGFQADPVKISRRNEVFFRYDMQSDDQLNGYLSVVTVDGKDVFLDPGNKFAPYGLLSWERTGVVGLRLDKEGGKFLQTPQPASEDAVTERIAEVKLVDGSLKGRISVNFKGQEALVQRQNALEEDAEEMKKDLEEEAKGWLPEGATVKMTKLTGIEATEGPVSAEFDIDIANFGAETGQRLILPLAIFTPQEGQPFRQNSRKHPIYFSYPFQQHDKVILEIPEGYQVEKLPEQRREMTEFARYMNAWGTHEGAVVMQRSFAMDGLLFQPDYYPKLREFYTKMSTSDQDNAVLRME